MKTLRWLSVALALLALLGSTAWLFKEIQASGTQKAEIAQLRATLEVAKRAAETNRLAYEADTSRARRDKAESIELRQRVRSLNEYVSQLEGNLTCLSDSDIERLRDLWGGSVQPPGSPAR